MSSKRRAVGKPRVHTYNLPIETSPFAHQSNPPFVDFAQAADLGALKAEGASQKSKLEQKLAARRQKKTEELRQREVKELKKKEARDVQAIQVQ